ncbi:MAG: cobyric acid synthase [Clostridium chrysemydis]|uniref:cobyric acid synthase n=1 Tax=Clostridium chrysemydis TaxID=2665504 RepID=UPI003F2A405A
MKYKGIMLLGTASSVGKSTLALGFCRYFKEKGYDVAPYKALNISLNSFVTKEGDEIGRAQVVQAEACEIEPKEYMNPILMKPSKGFGTQVIVRGKVHCTMDAYKYKELNSFLKEKAKEAYIDIKKDHDLIVLEGSGSCAEINLRDTDIANFQTAKMTDSDCILVADIDRGGVFASIVGTLSLLTEDERIRVKGVIINKFRGKKEFFTDAMRQLEDIIGVKVLGAMPYFNLNIEDEDSTEIKDLGKGLGIEVKVIRTPHMSNFTDFNSLERIENINLKYVKNPSELDNSDLIIIPGSKNTIEDLKYLKQTGFKEKLYKLKEEGTPILGICGGYQILGKEIEDPFKVEGDSLKEEGLNLLSLKTVFNKNKCTRQTEAYTLSKEKVKGYEIHNGSSEILDLKEEWIKDSKGNILGLKNGNVYGTYIHGLFDENEFLESFMKSIVKDYEIKLKNNKNYNDYKISQYDELLKILKENIDMEYVESLIKG